MLSENKSNKVYPRESKHKTNFFNNYEWCISLNLLIVEQIDKFQDSKQAHKFNCAPTAFPPFPTGRKMCEQPHNNITSQHSAHTHTHTLKIQQPNTLSRRKTPNNRTNSADWERARPSAFFNLFWVLVRR